VFFLGPLLAAAVRPAIVQDPIPYGARRKTEMAGYSRRHYGTSSWHLAPRVIVLHYTDSSTYRSAWSTFANNSSNLGELPGTCAHFIVGQTGVIHQLVATSTRCRHAIGLNHVAIGIEMVQVTGRSSHWADQQILHRTRQIHAVVALVRWLQATYGIAKTDVIGHAMANGSRLFRDDEHWRNDHDDWLATDVKQLRRLL
jgi:N-acetyl-anhydromuramyl-L-alanine amidase AmpD